MGGGDQQQRQLTPAGLQSLEGNSMPKPDQRRPPTTPSSISMDDRSLGDEFFLFSHQISDGFLCLSVKKVGMESSRLGSSDVPMGG
jgi:hypothetical protein